MQTKSSSPQNLQILKYPLNPAQNIGVVVFAAQFLALIIGETEKTEKLSLEETPMHQRVTTN